MEAATDFGMERLDGHHAGEQCCAHAHESPSDGNSLRRDVAMEAATDVGMESSDGHHAGELCCAHAHAHDSPSDGNRTRSDSPNSHAADDCQIELERDCLAADIYMVDFALKIDDAIMDGFARDFAWLLGLTDFLMLGDLVFTWRCTSRNLSVAILKHRAGAVEYLIHHSALVFAQVLHKSMGRLAPQEAAKTGDASTATVFRALALIGCAFNHKDLAGKTAAHYVAEWGNVASLRQLKELGCPMSDQDVEGKTVAHIAAELGDVKALRELKDLGCSMSTQDNDGETAAHLAAAASDIRTIRALHDLGCPLSTKNSNGQTVLDIAREMEDDDLLRAMGALISD